MSEKSESDRDQIENAYAIYVLKVRVPGLICVKTVCAGNSRAMILSGFSVL